MTESGYILVLFGRKPEYHLRGSDQIVFWSSPHSNYIQVPSNCILVLLTSKYLKMFYYLPLKLYFGYQFCFRWIFRPSERETIPSQRNRQSGPDHRLEQHWSPCTSTSNQWDSAVQVHQQGLPLLCQHIQQPQLPVDIGGGANRTSNEEAKGQGSGKRGAGGW